MTKSLIIAKQRLYSMTTMPICPKSHRTAYTAFVPRQVDTVICRRLKTTPFSRDLKMQKMVLYPPYSSRLVNLRITLFCNTV